MLRGPCVVCSMKLNKTHKKEVLLVEPATLSTGYSFYKPMKILAKRSRVCIDVDLENNMNVET